MCRWVVHCPLPRSQRWEVASCLTSLQNVASSCNRPTARGDMAFLFSAPFAPIVGGIAAEMLCVPMATISLSHSASHTVAPPSVTFTSDGSLTASSTNAMLSVSKESSSTTSLSVSNESNNVSPTGAVESSTTSASLLVLSATKTTESCPILNIDVYVTTLAVSLFTAASTCAVQLNTTSWLTCNSDAATLSALGMGRMLCATMGQAASATAVVDIGEEVGCLATSVRLNLTATPLIVLSLSSIDADRNVTSILLSCLDGTQPTEREWSIGVVAAIVCAGAVLLCAAALLVWRRMDAQHVDVTHGAEPLIEAAAEDHIVEGMDLWYDHADDIRASLLRDRLDELRAVSSETDSIEGL